MKPSDIIRIVIAAILLVVAAFWCSAAEQAMKIDSFTHEVKAPPASSGASYDFDFTGKTVGGISGGGGTPGGSNQQLQFNNSANFGGIPSFTYNTGSTLVTLQSGAKFNLADPNDTSKKVQLDLAPITTGTTLNIDVKRSVTVQKTVFVRTGGDDAAALREREDRPFATISTAVAAATSGDTIMVGPGTFSASGTITLPSGVSLVGSGIDVTKIVSTFSGASNAAFVPGTDSYVADLTIENTVSNVAPIGLLVSDTTFTSAILHRVKVVGNQDAFVFTKPSVTTTFKAYDCIARTTYDVLINGSSTSTFTVEFWNFDWVSDATGSGTVHGVVTSGANTLTRLFNGRIVTKGASGENIPINLITNGTVEAHNVSIENDGTGSTNYDLKNTGGSLKIESVTRTDGAALTTSGTITQMSRYALRDNNLSDVVNASTARTNLGLAIGTNVQAWDADLDSWAAITRASGFDTFTATPNSANLRSLLTDESGTGVALFGTSPTITTPTISGAISFPDGVRQTFNPDATTPGLNVGSQAGDPSTPTNGDLWYDSTANELTARINGANVALGAGGGSGTVTQVNTTTPITGGPITTTGTIALDVTTNFGFQSVQDITVNTGATNTPATIVNLTSNSTGTPANGFGPRLRFRAESNTTVDRTTGDISTIWSDATDATRSAYMDFLLVNNAATSASKMRLFPSGGLSVNNTTDPGAGYVNVPSGGGYKINNVALAASDVGAISDDTQVLGMQALGGGAKAMTLFSTPHNLSSSAFTLVDSQAQYVAVYLQKAGTITGVKWYQSVNGSYTGDNNNKVGLYSYSGGTLTKVAESTNDTALWSQGASAVRNKAFSSTYAASAGLYFVALLYNNSAQTTAPTIAFTSVGISANVISLDYTNSAKTNGTVAAQLDLPATQASSGITTSTSIPFVWIY